MNTQGPQRVPVQVPVREEQTALWNLPRLDDVPWSARTNWERFLQYRTNLFSRHFFSDGNFLTNENGFFHSIFLGNRTLEQPYRFAYVGPLVRFPSSDRLIEYLSADPQYAPILSVANGFSTIFYISGTSPTPDEGLDPTIFHFEHLCEDGDISGLNRNVLRQRMATHVGLNELTIPSPANPYPRRGTRPGFMSRQRFASGGDFYLDASLRLDPDPEDDSLTYPGEEESAIHGPGLFWLDWYEQHGDSLYHLPRPAFRALASLLMGWDIPAVLEFPRLQTVVLTEEYLAREANCGICMEAFSTREEVDLLPCGHFFHGQTCLRPWLRDSRTCPLCREPLRHDSSDSDDNPDDRMEIDSENSEGPEDSDYSPGPDSAEGPEDSDDSQDTDSQAPGSEDIDYWLNRACPSCGRPANEHSTSDDEFDSSGSDSHGSNNVQGPCDWREAELQDIESVDFLDWLLRPCLNCGRPVHEHAISNDGWEVEEESDEQ